MRNKRTRVRHNLIVNSKKSTEGITLIALIITILVLLILTGVSVAALTGENGIINKATGVKAEMTIAEEKEAISLAYGAAINETLENVTANDLKAELIVNGYDDTKVTVTEDGENIKVIFTESGNSYKVNSKGVIIGTATGITPPPTGTTPPEEEVLPSNTLTKPYFPGEEFKRVAGTNLDNGLVITDGTNYWTWVEVPKTEEIYKTSTLSLTPGSDRMYTETECTTIEADLTAYTETLLSKSRYKDEWYSGCGIASATEYDLLKRKMLSSVYTNGGFWIGQYEAGASTHVFMSDNEARTPICQKGTYIYNHVTLSEAQTLATSMNSGDRTSSLLFGLQWDLMIKHLQNKGVSESLLTSNSVTWGNYQDSEFELDNGKYSYNLYKGYKDYTENEEGYVENGRKIQNNIVLLTAGASKTNSKMNIYDLAGNIWEMTLEHATSQISSPCSYRGGLCNYPGSYLPAASRNYGSATEGSDYGGFRPTLY